MNNSNSGPSFGKKLLAWTSVILSIAFTMLKLQGYIEWSFWWVLSPLWIVAALYVVPFVIGVLCTSMWSNSMKKQVKSTCNDIVKLIQNTYESNVQEQANALYDKIKWIDDNEKAIRTAIPDHSTKRLMFMVRNKQHKDTCYGIGYYRGALSPSQRKSAVESLKSFEEDYSKLWF